MDRFAGLDVSYTVTWLKRWNNLNRPKTKSTRRDSITKSVGICWSNNWWESHQLKPRRNFPAWQSGKNWVRSQVFLQQLEIISQEGIQIIHFNNLAVWHTSSANNDPPTIPLWSMSEGFHQESLTHPSRRPTSEVLINCSRCEVFARSPEITHRHLTMRFRKTTINRLVKHWPNLPFLFWFPGERFQSAQTTKNGVSHMDYKLGLLQELKKHAICRLFKSF